MSVGQREWSRGFSLSFVFSLIPVFSPMSYLAFQGVGVLRVSHCVSLQIPPLGILAFLHLAKSAKFFYLFSLCQNRLKFLSADVSALPFSICPEQFLYHFSEAAGRNGVMSLIYCVKLKLKRFILNILENEQQKILFKVRVFFQCCTLILSPFSLFNGNILISIIIYTQH